MNDIVGLKLGNNVIVHHAVLNNDLVNAVKRFVKRYPFLKADGGKLVVSYKRLVAERADNNAAVLFSLVDDV